MNGKHLEERGTGEEEFSRFVYESPRVPQHLVATPFEAPVLCAGDLCRCIDRQGEETHARPHAGDGVPMTRGDSASVKLAAQRYDAVRQAFLNGRASS